MKLLWVNTVFTFLIIILIIILITISASKQKHKASDEKNDKKLHKQNKTNNLQGTSSRAGHGSSHAWSIGQIQEETRTLDEIYAAALAEGGRLIVYAGGDLAGYLDGTKSAFEARFPHMSMEVIVDYSKFHGPRIGLQLDNNSLVPDVAQLQTVHDFPRWKRMGVLMPYKPTGWSAIYEDYRDPDAHFAGITTIVFSNMVNTRLMPDESEWPRQASDFLKPKFGDGKLVITYPNDDDAVLFWFRQVVDKYGWDYMAKLAKQKPAMVRGTAVAGNLLKAANGTFLATMTASGPVVLTNASTNLVILPKTDPFVLWAQQAAIFKEAKHPEAAKLYLNYMLSKEIQQTMTVWPVRTDLPAQNGLPQSWEYKQTSHKAFAEFMADRDAVERFRIQIGFFLGEVQGAPTPGYLGLYQAKALEAADKGGIWRKSGNNC